MSFSLTTNEVVDSLRVGKNTITRLRQADVLRHGVHYVNVGVGAQRPTFRWDLDAVQATLIKRGKQRRRAA
ncbi:hypothetical protein [Cyanobium sp. PCC 7001]|uniref:hypothetical protein n=1 Tax=Cyanobium sp. PCC 7001 TaxID=180281 RepID=UPI0012E9EEA5|nr:hypothetical protein [Cyanobium sp. PCC 7001]